MKTLVLIVVAVVGVRGARAATYHVATTGDDSKAGTEVAPWRTIQRAVDEVAPGDRVIVHAGTYVGFVVEARGTSAQGIELAADGEVIIDGAATAERDAILVQGGAYVTITGFTVIAAARAGIAALDCEHITVRGNRIDRNGKWGVFSAFCDDLVVEDNEVSRSGEQHGVYASNSADRPVIRRNVIWGNRMCGVHMNGDVNFGGDGVISNAIVEANVIRDNGSGGGSAINGDGVADAVIRNNLLDGNHASGVSLYRIDGGAASTGNQVINNTVQMASDARWAINIQDGSSGNIVRNNIVLGGRGAIDLCTGCTVVSDHNAFVGRFLLGGAALDLAAWRTRTGGDEHSFVATEAVLASDFALSEGSPAIDAGDATGAPATDLAGTLRPQGVAIDLGAYEHCEGACVGEGDGDGDGGGDGDGDGGPDFGGPEPAEPEIGGCSSGSSTGGGLLLALALLLRRRR